MKTHLHKSREAAEMLAIQALGFIAEDAGRLDGFLSASGLTIEGVRAAAQDPDFLAGVLDHMLADENLLVDFATRAGIDPSGVAKARRALGKDGERDVP
jgi:hypothetical protein